jgi:FMN reductase
MAVSVGPTSLDPPPESSRRPIVVGLGGTLRAGSSTGRALDAALAAAEEAGAEVVLLGAAALQLPLYDPTAPATDAVEQLIANVRRADGVIIASPGYHGGPSGLVKNALDYLEELRSDERPYLDGCAVGCIACAAGWQATTTTLISLRSMVHALRGWPTPLGVAINSIESPFGPDGSIHEAVQIQLEILGRQVTEFALAHGTRSR